MPCNDWGSGRTCDGSCNSADLKRLRDRNDLLARMLCGLCTTVERRQGTNIPVHIVDVPGLAAWWKEHQELDRKRAAAEKKRKEDSRQRNLEELHALAKKLGKRVL